MSESTPFHKLSRQRRYQIRRNREGKCKICGKSQVKSRTGNLSGYCQRHLEMTRKISRKYDSKRRAKIKK